MAVPPVSLCPAGCVRGWEVPVAAVLLGLSSADPGCHLCRAFFFFFFYFFSWSICCCGLKPLLVNPVELTSLGFTVPGALPLKTYFSGYSLMLCGVAGISLFFLKYVFTQEDDRPFRCFVDEGKVYAQAAVPHPLSVFQACFLLCWQSFIILNS